MAEAAVSFALDRLAELLNHVDLQRNVRKEIENLQDELSRMRCFLRDADSKQDEDQRVRNWVSEIRNVAYDAEDLIDKFIHRAETLKKKKLIKRYASVLKEWRHRSKIANELATIQSRMQNISASREMYGINNIGEGSSTVNERLRKLRRSSPCGEDRDIVGLDNDIAKLMMQLVQSEDQWHAITIVGMGGIGKTTLAKKVYNHDQAQARFPSRAWVYVSQEFSARDILQAIIRQVAPSRRKLETLQDGELEALLHENLRKKRYLVILDDVWSVEAWDSLTKAFPNRNNGSRVVLTTRIRSIAQRADALTDPYDLQFLNNENDWKLFCSKAFIKDSDAHCSPKLEEVGKEIVSKCAGLPLAIIVIGGLLSRKRNLVEWKRVLGNMNSLFARDPNGVSAILALSYNDLPYYLKSCFLYLGQFPEDHMIPTHKLFRLWIAEGLIPQQRERMEDVAEDYLNELIERNMVQIAKLSVNHRVKQCRLHDLLRDLSISKAKAENFYETQGSQGQYSAPKSRRHAFYSTFHWPQERYSNPHLRSLLFFRVDHQSQVNYYINDPYKIEGSDLDYIGKTFKLLRTLDLEGITCTTISSTIGELIHLKYLGLKETNLQVLSSAIGSLGSLQTLDIAGNLHLRVLPNVLWSIPKLTHLYMCGHKYGGQLRIDTLRQLQTLSEIHVEKWSQNNTTNLISLRKLGMRGDFSSGANDTFKPIAALRKLESLYLRAEDSEFPSLVQLRALQNLMKLHLRGRIRELPAAPEFPPNLTQVTLEHTHLRQDSMAILEQLPNLLILRLRSQSYVGARMRMSADGFQELESLELHTLEALEEMNVEEGAMPRLKSFGITNCGKLKMLPDETKSLGNLREVVIAEMARVFVDRLRGEDSYKVQHVPTIFYL